MVALKASKMMPTGSNFHAKMEAKLPLFLNPLKPKILKDVPYEITDFGVRSPPKNGYKMNRN